MLADLTQLVSCEVVNSLHKAFFERHEDVAEYQHDLSMRVKINIAVIDSPERPSHTV